MKRSTIGIHVVAVIAGIAAILVLALTAVEHVAFDAARYEDAYARHGQAANIGMEHSELTRITGELLDYLRDDRKSLDGTVQVNGEEREIYREREKLHMVDVKNLFLGGFALRNWALVFLVCGILTLILACRRDALRILFRGYGIAFALVAVLGIALGIGIAVDFTAMFIRFHLLFFSNDLWLLAADDMLIMMFPEVFFNEMAAAILGRVGLYLFIPVCGWIAYRVSGGILRRRKANG